MEGCPGRMGFVWVVVVVVVVGQTTHQQLGRLTAVARRAAV